MNHVRNIKEMLNIPTGSRNAATSGYSSLTDSQLFFGSQFWLDNSQGTSQDVSLSSRNSQQSSQEGSEPKVFSSYHSKPPLFKDFKDKSRGSALLDKFEEDRKKAKEKNDSDALVKEFQHIRETLVSIQQLVAGTERKTAASQRVFEKFDSFASAFQNVLEGLQSDISQKFETLVDKLSSQKEVMTELEERVQKHVNTTAQLESHLQSLKNSLECLREEHKGERQMLEEALKLLNSLVSKHSAKPSAELVMDSPIQTSPELEQSASNNLQDSQLEDSQLISASLCVEERQVEASLQVQRPVFGKRRFTLRGHRRKKRPLVLPQKSKLLVSNENSRPAKKCFKSQAVSRPLRERRDQNTPASQDVLSPVNKGSRSGGAAGCFITPLSCWSQDSNSSECLAVIEPVLEKVSAESKAANPAKDGGFWQLFDSDLEF
ncbi:interactor of HORMAD1 protein 1 [Kryptolebias marmoratus]|uniref:interactor of HORMAD1 protein 1 n=1 Tax=Kryptolebias marmoratus TaxID=37003 RepID=UPI000D5307AE|nr:interactor of HORMAD1 protein 1 [Kryptolebias marmoratus]